MDDQANTKRLLSIGESADYLGVSIDTLRRWEKKGRITPLRSPGGHRYYSKDDLDSLFGKRYTRDEETQRRTYEELGKPIVEKEDSGINFPTSSPALEEKEAPEVPPILFVNEPLPINTPSADETIGIPSWRATAPPPVETPPSESTSFFHSIQPPSQNETFPPEQVTSDVISPPPSAFSEVKETPTEQVTKLVIDMERPKIEPVEKPIEPVAPSENKVETNTQTYDIPNILLPKKEEEATPIIHPTPEENILTPAEIESRIGVVKKTEKKNNFTDALLGIILSIILVVDFFLIYMWATSSRILSPIP